VEGTDAQRRQAFRDTHRQLEARIKLFVALPVDKLDRLVLTRDVAEIGRIGFPQEA
jgi:arsenate reductase (thioredoxin)